MCWHRLTRRTMNIRRRLQVCLKGHPGRSSQNVVGCRYEPVLLDLFSYAAVAVVWLVIVVLGELGQTKVLCYADVVWRLQKEQCHQAPGSV